MTNLLKYWIDLVSFYFVDTLHFDGINNSISAATIKIVPATLRNGIQLSQMKKTREVAQPILGTDMIHII